MRNLIITSYAYLENAISGTENKITNNMDLYMKCCVVALVSLKRNNKQDDVALVTNIDLSEKYREILQQEHVLIIKKEFDDFNFDKDMMWSLAFYKLCALKYVVSELEYDNYLLVDSDTYCIGNLSNLWKECTKKILLYDMQHDLENRQAVTMNLEYYELLGKQEYLTNWGGEFVAGPRLLLKQLISECGAVYTEMRKKNFRTKHGDEFILCVAAVNLNCNIKTANAYVFRYWTAKFYLVSTNYMFNAIRILHLPSEKERGIPRLYSYFLKHGRFPQNRKAYKMLSLPKPYSPLTLYKLENLWKSLIKKIEMGK